MSEYVLELKGITKIFPGVKALNNVQFQLKPGEVHALMGENGAGKSTFIKVITGVHKAEEGEMYLFGEKVDFKGPKDAQEAGIAAVYQHPTSYPHLTVAENIFMGHEIKKNHMIQWKAMNEEANKLLKQLNADFDSTAEMGTLSVAQQQMVEIAKALSTNAKIVILDEPTASLTKRESEELYRIVDQLKEKGVSIIFISHRFEDMYRLASRVTVFRDSQYIGTYDVDGITNADLIKAMVGREIKDLFPKPEVKIGDEMLRIEHLSRTGYFKDVSFNVHKGEIVGLAGLDGSGRTEVLENIFGVATRKSGVIRLHGKEVKNRRARDAIKNKFALLTEERRATGIFGILDIQENTTISSLKKYKVKGLYLSRKKMEESTEWSIRAMRIKTPSQDTKIRSLSGGNQQKVILGRWLLTDPEVLLLDEPTRGIDVGAKYEIYQLIINLAKEGKAVIMVSSEMPELLGVCDRILVMSGGRLAGEVDAKATTQEEIMTLAAKYA